MQFFDDGRVGLSFEPHVGTIRLLAEPARGGKPDFDASGSLVRLSDDACKLVGFSGRMGIRHQALIVRALLELGFRLLYIERSAGTVPLGEQITEGDFAGWWRLDLEAAARRAEERYA